MSIFGQTTRTAQLKPKFSLTVTNGATTMVSLQAENAQLTEVVAQLAQKTRLPISVSAKLKAERITANFSDVSLEGALRELAPQAYADYVVNGGWNMQPRCLGIFLQTRAEKQPAPNVSIQPRSEAFLLEGDTESASVEAAEKTSADQEPPLKVSVAQGLLTVRARQQPLTVVLYKIADSFGVPFELRYEMPDLIDLNVAAVTPVELLRTLPTATQLYYRRNLQNSLDKPLRLLLEKPALRKTLRDQRNASRKS